MFSHPDSVNVIILTTKKKVTWHLLKSAIGNNYVLSSFCESRCHFFLKMWNSAIFEVELLKSCKLLNPGYALGDDDDDGSGFFCVSVTKEGFSLLFCTEPGFFLIRSVLFCFAL